MPGGIRTVDGGVLGASAVAETGRLPEQNPIVTFKYLEKRIDETVMLCSIYSTTIGGSIAHKPVC